MKRLVVVALVLAGACASRVEPVRPQGTGVAFLVEKADRARREGRVDEAEAGYRHALRAEPRLRSAHVGLQEILRRRGLPLEARARYRRLGDPYLQGRLEGSPERAEEAFVEADEPERTLGLAQLALRRGAGDESEGRFSDVTAMDPGDAAGWLGRGRVRLARGAAGEAYEEFRHACWLAPSHPAAWSGLAACARRLGRAGEAREAARRAFEFAPLHAGAMDRMIASARRAGGDDALREAAVALRGAGVPRTVAGSLRAARLYAGLGDDERAAAARADAVRLGATQGEIESIAETGMDPPLARFVSRFAAGVEARYRHYRATGEAAGMEPFRDWARDLYERATGETLAPPGPIARYAFVGDLVDATAAAAEPLVRRLAAQGLVLVLGRRSGGGPPEAMLARVIRRDPRSEAATRGARVAREVVWIGERYVSGYVEWAGGGDLAGLALGDLVLIDAHAAAAWEGRLRRRRDALRARRERILSQEPLADAPVDAIDDPAGVADRLLLDAEPSIAAEVLAHEDAHLIDAARYLPGRGSLLAAFGLALRSGFAAENVLARLERNAQLTAIAEGPDPRTALAVCCAAIGGRGVHARGYAAIVKGIVRLVLEDPGRYPAIRRDRVIVQQLHALTTDQIRDLALELGRRWGVREDS